MGICDGGAPAEAAYSRSARRLHWSSVALLGMQFPIGLFMVRYGVATDFAAPSGILYDGHKLLGLLIPAARGVAPRLSPGARRPAVRTFASRLAEDDEPCDAHVTRGAIYANLFAVPLLGWLAISYYGSFRPFGLALPVNAAENGDRAQHFLPSTAWPPTR